MLIPPTNKVKTFNNWHQHTYQHFMLILKGLCIPVELKGPNLELKNTGIKQN